MSGHHKNDDPIELHDQQLQYLEHRYIEHVNIFFFLPWPLWFSVLDGTGQRIRITMSGHHKSDDPIELHDQQLHHLEHRYIEHVNILFSLLWPLWLCVLDGTGDRE